MKIKLIAMCNISMFSFCHIASLKLSDFYFLLPLTTEFLLSADTENQLSTFTKKGNLEVWIRRPIFLTSCLRYPIHWEATEIYTSHQSYLWSRLRATNLGIHLNWTWKEHGEKNATLLTGSGGRMVLALIVGNMAWKQM